MQFSTQGVLLFKTESTYGTDPTPTVGANLIAVSSETVAVTYNSEPIDRGILDGSFNSVVGLNVLPWIEFSFQTEWRGNRTDGVADDISKGAIAQAVRDDALWRACDCAATYTAESGAGARNGNVTYKPTLPTNEGVGGTAYFYDGDHLFKATGCKGDVKGVCEAGKPGLLNWTFRGIYNSVTDAARPATSMTDFVQTIPPDFAGAGLFSLDAFAAGVYERVEFALGNTITERPDLNSSTGLKGFAISGRNSRVNWTMESTTEATFAAYAKWKARTYQVLTLNARNTDTGNKLNAIFTGAADKVQLSERGKIRQYNVDFACRNVQMGVPGGNDFLIKYF